MTKRLMVVCALLALAPAAHAESKDELEARTLFREGNRRLEAQDYAAALELFRSAYARFPSVKILLNLGTTLRTLGREAEAADVYERYLADPKAEPRRRAEVERLVKELDGRLGRLRIVVTEPGAKIVVDGREVGLSPVLTAVRAEPRSHTVTAAKAGFRPAVVTVAVAAREEKVVEVQLEPLAEPAAARPASPAPEPPTPAPVVVATPSPREDFEGRGFGGVVRSDIDGKGRGAVAVVGAYVGLWRYLEFSVAGIIGQEKGLYVGAAGLLPLGRFRPLVQVGMPLFFIDGARPGIHAAGGVEWVLHRYLGLVVTVGVQHYFSLPADYDRTIFVPSVGALVRL